jgi:uncharacterized protein (TIGR02996 family)
VEDEAFLLAIAEEPADDVRRLVYADWLDERDDPRAAFLRAEVAFARSGLAADGQAELLALRAQLDPAWWRRVARGAGVPQVFRCAACRLPLTRPLRLLADPVWLSGSDGTPLVPAGYYWPSDGTVWGGTEGHCCVNLSDLQNVQPHPQPGRRNGCCGVDGLDGINTVCRNGHEVGTECSDCWMPHFLHLPPGAVEIVDAGAAESGAPQRRKSARHSSH